MIRTGLLIRFRRDLAFPRFSVDAGECWFFGDRPGEEPQSVQLGAVDRFVFAGGVCLTRDVEVVYDGDAYVCDKIEQGLSVADAESFVMASRAKRRDVAATRDLLHSRGGL